MGHIGGLNMTLFINIRSMGNKEKNSTYFCIVAYEKIIAPNSELTFPHNNPFSSGTYQKGGGGHCGDWKGWDIVEIGGGRTLWRLEGVGVFI